MRINSIAVLTGATQKALRYYEALGLLGTVPRQGRYRAYGAAHVELVALIRRAQRFGFSLAELAAARDGQGGIDWGRVLHLVRHKQGQLQLEQARLARQIDELAAIARELSQCPEIGATSTASAAAAPADCLLPPAR